MIRWLVVRGGALGDFVLTTPAIRAVRRVADHLTVACTPRYLEPWPDLADATIDLRGTEALWLFGSGSPPDPLPDAALVYTPTVADTLRALGVSRVLEADVRPPAGTSALEHAWAPVAHLAGERPDAPVAIPDPRRLERLAHRLAAPVVLAPGAGAARKRWHGFGRLAALLVERGHTVTWVPGRDLAPQPPPPEVDVASDLDLCDLVALASICTAWVGNDTGTSWLAAAAGAPLIALFGPTDPRTWAPPGARVVAFSSPPEQVADLVEEVIRRAPRRMGGRP